MKKNHQYQKRSRATQVKDSYYSSNIGIGSANDKLANTTYSPSHKTSSQLIEFYQNNAIATKIVENLATDTTSNWRNIECINPTAIELINNNDKSLKMWNKCADYTREIVISGVCFVLIVTNNSELSIELQKTEQIIDLIILDKNRVQPSVDLVDDFTKNNFGEPYQYIYNSKIIHNTRIIKLVSHYIPSSVINKQTTSYPSLLNCVYDDIIAYDINIRALTQMVQDSSIPILKSKHVQNLLNSQNGRNAFNAYLTDQLINKSIYRTTVLNSDDVMERLEVGNLSSVSTVIERIMESICAKTNQSMKKLFGLQAKGLSSDADINAGWNSYCLGWQTSIYEKLLNIVDRHILRFNNIDDEYTSEWQPVEVVSAKESSETLDKCSNALGGLVDKGVITPLTAAQELIKRGLIEIPADELNMLQAMSEGDNVGA